jgi:hypothetical protein
MLASDGGKYITALFGVPVDRLLGDLTFSRCRLEKVVEVVEDSSPKKLLRSRSLAIDPKTTLTTSSNSFVKIRSLTTSCISEVGTRLSEDLYFKGEGDSTFDPSDVTPDASIAEMLDTCSSDDEFNTFSKAVSPCLDAGETRSLFL